MVKQKKSKAGRKTLVSQGKADEKKLPGGLSQKIWDGLSANLQIENTPYVVALSRSVLEIYLDERLQEEARRQNVAPSVILIRARDWYLNSIHNGRSISENDIVVSKSE